MSCYAICRCIVYLCVCGIWSGRMVLLVQLCIFCMMSAVTKLSNGLPCIEVAPLNRERSLHPISSEPGSSTAMVRNGQSGGPSVIHGLIRCADRAVTEDIPSPKETYFSSSSYAALRKHL